MKRQSESETSLRHLKRANSSVFSIATIVDDSDVESRRTTRTSVAMAGKPPPQPPTAPSLPETDGFFVASGDCGDDDDGDDRIDASTLDTSSYLPVLSPSRKTKKSTFANDKRVGVVFESSDGHYDRNNRLHKERPLRITSIKDYLMRKDAPHNLARRCKIFGDANAVYKREEGTETTGTIHLATSVDQFLDDEDYLRVHLAGYMQRLDRLSGCSCTDRLDCEAEQYQSIYFAPGTVACAKNAAASLCRLVSDVVEGKLDNGFAVIRPPGHHASGHLAGGYCVLNNVAVAAEYAREKLGVAKTLIVDWDIHHGNGTQSAFLSDPNVLYFSVHRYHNGNYFPFEGNGGPDTVGTGMGAGFNVNVGWNQKNMGDEEYYAVWSRVLMPLAQEFLPDLVLVSAGFDGALGDMGECSVTPKCFANLAKQLMNLAKGKVVCSLEGGYVRSALAKCCEAVILALLTGGGDSSVGSCSTATRACGDSGNFICGTDEEEKKIDSYQMAGDGLEGDEGHSRLPPSPINPSAETSIQTTINAHTPYWKCFGKTLEGLDE